MTTAIAKTDEQSVLAQYSREQVDLIKSQVAPRATDDELKLFLYVCKQRGLDPLAKQIYCIHRNDKQSGGSKMTIQTSIDGFRSLAARTETYAPGEEAWVDNDKGYPVSATVSVRKLVAGKWIKFSATAHMNEYNAATPLWGKMPHVMIAKCAEAKALRKGWPELLGGLYSDDEMEQADRFAALAPEAPKQAAASKPALVDAPKKKSLPPLPDEITIIPPEILAFMAPLRPLTNVSIGSMKLEDLELCVEQCRLFRPKMKTDEGKKWLAAIDVTASHFRGEREAENGNQDFPQVDEEGNRV